MNLYAALEHLIEGGWEAPNRMLITRFRKGEISDKRIRTILKSNGYYCVCQESWAKANHKHTP